MKYVLILVVAVAFSISNGFAQSFDWSRSSRSTTITMASAIATDPNGTSVVTGNFYGQTHFDTLSLFSQARDIFIVKYGADGKRLWARGFGSTADDFGNAITYDSKGNILLTGSFTFKMPMDKDTLLFSGDHDVVVAKLDPNGKVLWAKSAGGRTGGDHGQAIACDTKGNTYVAGFFRDSANFDRVGIGAFSKGLFTLFLAKYDNSGNCLWAKPIGSSNYQSQTEGVGLDVDSKGNAYLSAGMHGVSQIDTMKRIPTGIVDIFIAKFSPSGTVEWMRTAGGPTGLLGAKALKCFGSSVYVCGNYITSASFDGGKSLLKSTLGYQNAFLAKYDTEGNFKWVKDGSSRGQKSCESMAIDPKENIYIGATFTDSLCFDSTLIASSGRQSLAAISFASDGSLRWMRPAGRTGVIITHGVGVDKHGNSYYTGIYNDTAAFGKEPLFASLNGQDMFITKLSGNSDYSLTKKTATAAKPNINSVDMNAGKKQLTVDFDVAGLQYVTIELYDMLGNVVSSYTDQQLSTGNYQLSVDLKKQESDAYYVRIQIGLMKKMNRIEF
jgi:hypothetical protein